MSEAYRRKRTFYQDISGANTTTATDTTKTLVTIKNSSYTLYIQRIVVFITTSAAQSWTFQDNGATPLVVAVIPSSPGVNTRWDFDFGETGVPLGSGNNFQLKMSAAGNAGQIEWYGYSVLNNATAVASA